MNGESMKRRQMFLVWYIEHRNQLLAFSPVFYLPVCATSPTGTARLKAVYASYIK
jgi:hypothetical protein